MKFEIRNRWSGAVQYTCELSAEVADKSYSVQLGFAVKKAIAEKANLSAADLSAANLSAADLSAADLQPIRADFYDVLSWAPAEVPALIAALKEGRVDGSTYTGTCACLVGTIANVRGVDVDTLPQDSYRPIERFFMSIRQGDTPETNQHAAVALGWAETWLASMQAAFAPKSA